MDTIIIKPNFVIGIIDDNTSSLFVFISLKKIFYIWIELLNIIKPKNKSGKMVLPNKYQ